MGGDAARRGTANRGTQNRGTKRRVQAITALVDENKVVFTLDDGTTVAIEMSYNGRPPPGRHVLARRRPSGPFAATPPIAGAANARGLVLAWTHPDEVTFEGVTRYTLTVVAGRTTLVKAGNLRGAPEKIALAAEEGVEGTAQEGAAAAADEGENAANDAKAKGIENRGTENRGTDDPGTAAHGVGDDPASDAADGGVGFDADLAMLVDAQDLRLAPDDEDAWRAIAKLAVGRGETPPDPVELIRQYRMWMRHVDQQVFADEGGEQWSKVMKFLDDNQHRLEGDLHATKSPGFSVAALEKLLEEHERIVAPESVDERDPDDPLRYDPGVALLTPGERKLLADVARLHPDMVSDGTIKQPYISILAKVLIALRLTYKSWPKEVAAHAEKAFSDPVFIVTTVTILGVYWALWLVPDPTAVTKAAAAALTAVMLYYFAKDVVLAFLLAVRRLFNDCDKTVRLEELEAAGRRFAKAVGKVGFEILLFLVTWRIGKRVEPTLREYGAARQVARSEARLAEIKALVEGVTRSDPAASVPNVLAKARAAAGDRASPAKVLETLREMLPEDARAGLDVFAGKMQKKPRRPADVLGNLENMVRSGEDVVVALRKRLKMHRQEALKPARQKAEAGLVRARMNQQRVHDQRVRRAIRREQIKRFLATMEKRGVLARLAAIIKQRMRLEKQDPDTFMALVAEAITVAELRHAYPESRGFKVLANVEIVRRVEEFSSIAEWQAANPGKKDYGLREAEGKLWKSVTEIDGMAVVQDSHGRWRIVEIEQAKSGKKSHDLAQATDQNQSALDALKEIAAGSAELQVFMPGAAKGTVGANITSNFRWEGLAIVKKSTRGPTGAKPPFDKDLYGMTRDNLALVVEELMENPTPMDTPMKSLPVASDDGEAAAPGGAR